jgi:DNA polymerase-1
VIKKYGVPPEKIIDYLALMGDASDNIPGVEKVGPKTAVKWLTDYGSLDEIIAQASNISGKIGENLRVSLEKLSLAKQLVTLRRDVALPCTVEDLSVKTPDQTTLRDWYLRLEFKQWLKDVLPDDARTPSSKSEYQTILTQRDFEAYFVKLNAASQFAFDTETTSLNTLVARLVGLSFSIEPDHAVYIPLAHDYLGAPEQLSLTWVLEKIKPLLQDQTKTLIGQNIKYDAAILANYDMAIHAKLMDTMLESYVLNSASNRHDLDSLALKHLGKQTITFEKIAGKGVKQLAFNEIPIDVAAPYAAEDADMAWQLHQQLWSQISEYPDVKRIFLDIEMPLIPVLLRMERFGVRIDPDLLARQSQEITARLSILEAQAHQAAGTVFNLASPKQLQNILYTTLQLPILEKTPGGAPSTAESVLQELALNYPLPKIILEHRSLSKLKSTYTDSLPKQIHVKTGRIHTSYNQAVTSTGRLSSTNPNLQNIPIRHEQGRKIRQAFIALPGYKIISADYSQIELRIMAHLSQDLNLCKAFEQGHDIHAATAAEVFNLSLDAVSSEQRRHAKAINFGLIYGMSAFGLAKQLGITHELAQAYIQQYFSRYPGVQQYMENTRELARKQGYVSTLLGRRLYVSDINSAQMQRRKAAERAAINAPMQGTAADMIKLAMIQLDAWLQAQQAQQRFMNTHMIMQVHDELVFETAEEEADAVIPFIRDYMTQVMPLLVPLAVNISMGNNWDEAH